MFSTVFDENPTPAAIHKEVQQFKPRVVVIDPITNLINIGSVSEVKSVLMRMIDLFQNENITVLFTALTLNNTVTEQTDEGVSSQVDSAVYHEIQGHEAFQPGQGIYHCR
jgi:circadian clock protein KaiC